MKKRLFWRFANCVWLLFCGTMAIGQADPSQAVVYIECKTETGETSQGSGYIFSQNGHVLTAKHVVPEGSTCTGLIGSADETPTRELEFWERSPDFDFAILKFNPRGSDNFTAADIAPSVQSFFGSSVKAMGFPKDISTLTTRVGTVANAAIDAEGHFDIGTDITRGMSGGPVIANGMIIGLVAGADLDLGTGLPRRYEALASDRFYDKLSSVRDDIERNEREKTFADLAQNLNKEDVCTVLLREAIQRRYPDAIPGLQPAGQKPPSNALGDIAEYWVTITTGPARWLDCSEDNRTQRSHYFPMGLVLRPIRDVNITDDSGEDQVWTVFQTEYGMLVLINRRAVAPVSPDVGYVFAEGTFIHKLCGPNDGDDCNPGANLPPLNNLSSAWPFLTSFYSYLRTTDVAGLEAANAEYVSFRDNRRRADHYEENGITPPFTFTARKPLSLEEDEACKPRSAYLYRYLKPFDPEQPDNNSEYRVPVRYSFCFLPPSNAPNPTVGWRPMKVVTRAIADEIFDQLWWAAVEPEVTEITNKALKLLENREDLSLTRIECLSNGATAPLPTASDAGLSFLDVLQEEQRVRWRNADPEAGYYFRMYRPARGASPSATLAEVPLYQDIDLKIFCGNDRKPVRATDIRVHLYPVFPDPIVLNAVELENWYLETYQSYGFEGRRHLSNGFIERICDYPEYYGWRDTLERFLLQDAQIINLSKSRLRVEKEVTARHFAHLIMAVLFFTDVQLQIDDDTAGVCPI